MFLDALAALLSGLFFLGITLLLPGLLLVRALTPDLGGALRWIAGLVVGGAVVPTLAFGCAMAVGSNLRPSLMLGVAAVLSALALLAAELRSRSAQES